MGSLIPIRRIFTTPSITAIRSGIRRHCAILYSELVYQKPRPIGATAGLFLLGYGIFRFIVEFFREPDAQLGLYFGQHISMGQILSTPMILIGAVIMLVAYQSAGKKR